MKTYVSIFILFFTFPLFAQVPQYRTINAALLISATKDGQAFRFTNKRIMVNLDYKAGNFLLKLTNTDFYRVDSASNNNIQDTLDQEQYIFSGILPINDILNQQTTEQNYNIELQLSNDNLNIYQTINMNMTITVPNVSGQANYRIFNMNGVMYNDELQLPAFTGFDNEIDFWIQFSGIATSN